ncbi:MAG TPA: heme o synthase [Actinomycetota bacterium]|jgi:protoheme IX farnesyltransferase|nr:heme o synthase [Actinomycetota bacterium]
MKPAHDVHAIDAVAGRSDGNLRRGLSGRDASGPRAVPAQTATVRDRVLAYVALTKPRIVELLLITTVPAMILAARGVPSLELMVATLFGGALAAGGANALNCYIDRDIDRIMGRTRRRPLPRHQIAPRSAVIFGLILGTVSFAFMWAAINFLAAALTLGALLFYVFVYTLGMKRSTPQNIVIGGAAGAVPALVGWAAVTGGVGLPALVLFGIVFYWTPPHFWALSLRYSKEYEAAGVPMMPVVYGKKETTRHIVLYSLLLFAVSLILLPVAHLGAVYLAACLGLNGMFIFKAVRLAAAPAPRSAWNLFHFSNYYLALLFTAAAADVLIGPLL